MWANHSKSQSMERKSSRPRGATIGGASPLRKAAQNRKKKGVSEENLAQTLHEEELEMDIQEEDIRKSMSEDSLTAKLDKNRLYL